jgi:hypothetical protein
MMQLINEQGAAVLPAGKILLQAGGALPGKRSAELGAVPGVQAAITVQ